MRQLDARGAEARVRGDAGAQVVPEPPRDVDGVALDDEVELVAGRRPSSASRTTPPTALTPAGRSAGRRRTSGMGGDPARGPGG